MMRPVAVALVLLVLLSAGCFGGGKGKGGGGGGDDTDGGDTGTGSGNPPGPGTSGSGTTTSGVPAVSGGSSSTGAPGPGGGASSDDSKPARRPDLWFNGSRMDLVLKGDGTVRDLLLEATVPFAIHSAVATQAAGVAAAMVPETTPAAACTTGAAGPLVAAGEPWLDTNGLGERPAGRYRFVYREPATAAITFILGDVTLDDVRVEAIGQPSNATIEVRAATWAPPSAGQPHAASDAVAIAGRAVVAAGARVDYDTAAGPVRASNDVEVGGADCAQGQRDANAGASFGHLEHAVVATVQDAQVGWSGSLSGVFVNAVPSGGLIVFRLA